MVVRFARTLGHLADELRTGNPVITSVRRGEGEDTSEMMYFVCNGCCKWVKLGQRRVVVEKDLIQIKRLKILLFIKK